MKIPFLSLLETSPFDGLAEHVQKVKECAWAFQEALECHTVAQCERFDQLRSEVVRLENEADAIKRRIRGHLPKGIRMPVQKFQVFMYLKEQDSVLDSVEDTLDWLSYRPDSFIPEALQKDFFLLVDAVVESIEELNRMVAEAKVYFKKYLPKQRDAIKEIIRNIRNQEHEADIIEDDIKKKAFDMKINPVQLYFTVHLAEIIGTIADHAENAGDMMRAMISR